MIDPKELALWETTAKVRAIRITALSKTDGMFLVRGSLHGQLTADIAKVTSSWIFKNKPEVGGYFVTHEDGTTSYASAPDFEKKHELVEPAADMRLENVSQALLALLKAGEVSELVLNLDPTEKSEDCAASELIWLDNGSQAVVNVRPENFRDPEIKAGMVLKFHDPEKNKQFAILIRSIHGLRLTNSENLHRQNAFVMLAKHFELL